MAQNNPVVVFKLAAASMPLDSARDLMNEQHAICDGCVFSIVKGPLSVMLQQVTAQYGMHSGNLILNRTTGAATSLQHTRCSLALTCGNHHSGGHL